MAYNDPLLPEGLNERVKAGNRVMHKEISRDLLVFCQLRQCRFQLCALNGDHAQIKILFLRHLVYYLHFGDLLFAGIKLFQHNTMGLDFFKAFAASHQGYLQSCLLHSRSIDTSQNSGTKEYNL